MKQQPVLFIGLGQMGQPMAFNLLNAGFELIVYDQDEEKMASLVAQGAQPCTSLRDLPFSADMLLCTMVPGDQELLDLVTGRQGWISRVVPGMIHLSFSTISPATTRLLTEVYRTRGACFLGCNVLGRPNIAKGAKLTMFASGDATARQRVQPVFAALSTNKQGKALYDDFGPDPETSNVVKIAANACIGMALEILGEAALLLRTYGINPAPVIQSLIDDGSVAGHVYQEYGVTMIGKRTYTPALFPVPLGFKDMRLALETGRVVEVPLPLVDLAHEHLRACVADPALVSLDWSVLAEAIPMSPQKIPAARTQTSLVALVKQVILLATLESLGEVACLLATYGIEVSRFFAMLVESGLFGGTVYTEAAQRIALQRYTVAHVSLWQAYQLLLLLRTFTEQAHLVLPVLDLLERHLTEAEQAGKRDLDWSSVAEFGLTTATSEVPSL